MPIITPLSRSTVAALREEVARLRAELEDERERHRTTAEALDLQTARVLEMEDRIARLRAVAEALRGELYPREERE